MTCTAPALARDLLRSLEAELAFWLKAADEATQAERYATLLAKAAETARHMADVQAGIITSADAVRVFLDTEDSEAKAEAKSFLSNLC